MALLKLFRPEDAVEPPVAGETKAAAGRRERAANPGTVMLTEALGQKVLHGWLQNRHQTLVPLTLNFRALSEAQRSVVIGALAALARAGRGEQDADAASGSLREWLMAQGAQSAQLDEFARAMQSPPPLNEVLERGAALDVTVYVYIAALVASDSRFPASLLLCDVVQARFDLPSAIVRTATRRYRR